MLASDRTYEALATESVNYDLLITPAKPRASLIQRIRGTNADKLSEGAMCSVLRLQAPASTTHAAFERYRSTAAKARKFIEFVHPECTAAKLEHKKKEELFVEVAEVFSEQLDGVFTETIIDALWERERTQNTGLGKGIALPHATISTAAKTHLGVLTTAAPMDYKAHDGVGVDVFFVTIGTPGDRNEHLVLLGSIARLSKGTALLERLRTANSSEDILIALRECSDELNL